MTAIQDMKLVPNCRLSHRFPVRSQCGASDLNARRCQRWYEVQVIFYVFFAFIPSRSCMITCACCLNAPDWLGNISNSLGGLGATPK